MEGPWDEFKLRLSTELSAMMETVYTLTGQDGSHESHVATELLKYIFYAML